MISEENVKKKSRRKIILIIALIVFVLYIAIELIRSNTYIQVEEFTFKNELVPDEFDGCKIVHISDFHNQGENFTDRLVKKTEEQNPDYIFITGDICDSMRTDIDDANYFIKKISAVAPCYLIWGNHDYNVTDDERQQMWDCAEKNGVTVLESNYTTIEKNGESVLLVGTSSYMNSQFTVDMLEDFPQKQGLTLWLHHYPEDFSDILETSQAYNNKADLVFSGHAHGGLIGLPFDNGVYSPGQGILPEYTSGDYYENESMLLVSRGVGNSSYTKRFLNPFHLVVCTLEKE